ncbi:YhcH/YjgK/YiaL family protein [Ferrimonas sediminum]|uniref:YhcH/YjgK/YiaL family protein n=1 Tax=Ferrimonas sediminum TaxID=718193 RepID=A0A1G9BI69_9GAMM|nr:YhcH/YjgK/YiaL family protein [Ferrimonas sediminum]SDK39216.1 YhcH/YjgK/YiaL family protein [Ferrimonas sediminum]
MHLFEISSCADLPEEVGKCIRHVLSLGEIPAGLFEVPGSAIKAIGIRYVTKDSSAPVIAENHQRVVDVHVVVQGGDGVAVVAEGDAAPSGDYCDKDDYQLFDVAGELELQELTAGHVAVFEPYEIHVTGRAVGEPGDVVKVVLKVPAELFEG